jgi:addiction module RelE/StbE family toxin
VKLFWTFEAIEDRRAIYAFVEAESPTSAIMLDDLFSGKSRRLISHPQLGRPGRVGGTRELVINRSYVLIYDIAGEYVRLLRVLNAARQWPPTSGTRQDDA